MKDVVCVPPSFGNRDLWEDVLTRWTKFLTAYEDVSVKGDDPDLAYWYVEKSLTGLLGAAAWSEGGWSLEEFSTVRGGEKSPGAGHGDLWFGRGSQDVTVEAKICWIDHQTKDLENALTISLEEANKQLHDLSTDTQCGQLVAVSYVVPWYAKPKRRENGENALAKLTRYASKPKFATAVHYATKNNNTEDEGRKYPGVLLVAQDVTV